MKWITIIKHVDLETGEEISEWIKEYTIINRIKKITVYEKYATIEYTKRCRRKPKQGDLFTNSRENRGQ